MLKLPDKIEPKQMHVDKFSSSNSYNFVPISSDKHIRNQKIKRPLIYIFILCMYNICHLLINPISMVWSCQPAHKFPKSLCDIGRISHSFPISIIKSNKMIKSPWIDWNVSMFINLPLIRDAATHAQPLVLARPYTHTRTQTHRVFT